MFDLGWTEFIVVAVVAILVVGPKELPGMLRTIGKTIGSARRMAGDFQRQFNDALREADLDGIKSGIDSVNKINPVRQIKDSLNPIKQAADDVQRDINKGLLKSSEKAAPASTPAVSTDPVDTPAKPVEAKAAAKSKPATARATAKKPTAKKPAASKRSAGKTAAPAKAVAKPSATKQPARKTAAKSAAKSAKAPKKETDA